MTNFSINQNLLFGQSSINLMYGYSDKIFGANNFYSDLYPNQWEHTTTNLFNITSELGSNNFSLSPKIFWRKNDDEYLLDNSRPAFYRNLHKTYSYGGEIQASLQTNYGTTSLGGEINKEEIYDCGSKESNRFVN